MGWHIWSLFLLVYGVLLNLKVTLYILFSFIFQSVSQANVVIMHVPPLGIACSVQFKYVILTLSMNLNGIFLYIQSSAPYHPCYFLINVTAYFTHHSESFIIMLTLFVSVPPTISQHLCVTVSNTFRALELSVPQSTGKIP